MSKNNGGFFGTYDDSNISGHFEVKHVGIAKLLYDRLFGGGHDLKH